MNKLEPGDLLIIVGGLLIAGGVALLSVPFGVIVLGAEFVVSGVAALRATPQPTSEEATE